MFIASHRPFQKERSVAAPKRQLSPAGQSPIQPLRELFEQNLELNSPMKSLFQPSRGLISSLVSKSALGNWNVLALIKEATSEPKKEDYIFLTENSQFLGLKQISPIYSDK